MERVSPARILQCRGYNKRHMPRPGGTEFERLQTEFRALKMRVALLERLTSPTRTRRSVLDWLQNDNPAPRLSFTDVIRTHDPDDNLLPVLQSQGLTKAVFALCSHALQPGAPECPLRSYDLAPSTLYGYDGSAWIKIGPAELTALRRQCEQWFMRAIRAEHAPGSETGSLLLQKILTGSLDTKTLRGRLAGYLRRTLKEVRIYEFEP